MNIEVLYNTPPWDWPENAGNIFLAVLGNRTAPASERLMAAEMAGNPVVVNDRIAKALLDVLRSGDEPEELRGMAAIALGPALEHAYLYEFDDPDDTLLSEMGFDEVRQALQRLYQEENQPRDVRRRILEASIRDPQEWHREAIRAAYASPDDQWQLTAVFCMQYRDGFDQEILEALNSANPEIRREAVRAAGNYALDAAWRPVAGIIREDEPDKELLLPAIYAAAAIRPQEAGMLLVDLMNSDDEDISEAVFEALALAQGPLEDDDFEDEDDRIFR